MAKKDGLSWFVICVEMVKKKKIYAEKFIEEQ